MVDLGLLDYAARWVALSMCFFFLVHCFGDHIHIEGALGYIFPLFVVVPVNVMSHVYVRSLATFAPVSATPPALGFEFLAIVGMLLIVNFLMLLPLGHILPGMSFSGAKALLVFCFFVSAISYSLWMVPPLPPILGLGTGGAAQMTWL